MSPTGVSHLTILQFVWVVADTKQTHILAGDPKGVSRKIMCLMAYIDELGSTHGGVEDAWRVEGPTLFERPCKRLDEPRSLVLGDEYRCAP